MKHYTLPSFWKCYHQLPNDIRELADKNYKLLSTDRQHPSLQLKKVGKMKQLWSIRIGIHYRALGLDKRKELFGSGLEHMLNMIRFWTDFILVRVNDLSYSIHTLQIKTAL